MDEALVILALAIALPSIVVIELASRGINSPWLFLAWLPPAYAFYRVWRCRRR
jgi:hypothetical protein